MHGGLWALLWLLLLSFPEEAAADGLDPSWRAILAHDWLDGAAFGLESVFTYGPLTYFIAPQAGYVPELFWERVTVELLAKLAVLAGLVMLVSRLRSGPVRLLAQLLLLAMAPLLKDSVYLITLIALPIAVLEGRRVPATLVLAALALMSLVKFTFLVLAVPCVLAMALQAALRGERGRGLATALGFPVLFVLAWTLVAGQPLGNLFTYLRHSLAVATGYNASSALPGDATLLVYAVVTLSLIGIALLLRAWPRDVPARLVTLVAAAGLFLTWKAGFVRQDDGHTLMFFPVATILGMHLIGRVRVPGAESDGERPARGVRVIVIMLLATGAIVVSSLGAFRAGALLGYTPAAMRPVLVSVARRNADALLDMEGFRADRQTIYEELQRQFALPAIAARVGDAPVDLISHEQGVLYLNGFHVRHRPAIQGYIVADAVLQDLNGRFLASDDGPRFVLYKHQPTGRLFPTVQDSQALIVLLERFRPVLFERGYLLLEKRDDAPPAREDAVVRLDVSLGDWVELETPAGFMTRASFDIRPSLTGRLRALLFRPAPLELEVRLAGGQLRSYRIAPPIAELPFLLSPLPQNTLDALHLWDGGPVAVVEALRIRTSHPGCWAHDIGVELLTGTSLVPGAPLTLSPELESAALASQFAEIDPGPGRLVAADRVRVETRPVGDVFAAAPSLIALELPAGTYRLHALFQVRADAYDGSGDPSGGGKTSDGMAFGVRIVNTSAVKSGGVAPPADVLFERFLDPAAVPADRERILLDVPLQLAEPSRVELFTDPGPAGNGSLDRAYWSDIRVDDPRDGDI